MKNCSFASMNSCHQDTYTKLKELRAVDEEKKNILHLRTKVPVQDISMICHHHEQSLDIKFSHLIKRCADPFQQHKQSRTKSLRLITMDMYSKMECLQDKAVPGEKLCPSCLVQATKSIYTAQGKTSEPSAGPSAEPSTGSTAEPSAGPSALPSLSLSSIATTVTDTTNESSEPDVSLKEVNAALVALEQCVLIVSTQKTWNKLLLFHKEAIPKNLE